MSSVRFTCRGAVQFVTGKPTDKRMLWNSPIVVGFLIEFAYAKALGLGKSSTTLEILGEY